MSASWVCLECGRRYDEHRRACGACWAQNRIVDIGRRVPAAVDREPELTSARDLVGLSWKTLESARYPELKLGKGCFGLLVGPPGSGKSSKLCGLLDGVRGPVLLLSVEEPSGPALSARLLRVGCTREDFLVLGHATIDQLTELLRASKPVVLGIDSIQPSMFTPREVRHLLNVIPTLHGIFATAQVNGEGQIMGVRAVEHEADLVLDIESMGWRLRKSRYQSTGLTVPVRLAKSPVAA